MSGRIAEFAAYVALTSDGGTVLESDEARVRMTREDVTVSDGDTRRTLSISDVVAFDFQTVPEEWEEFFDDLVGVKFRTDDGVVTATIGTDTRTMDRFTTVLLKLLVDDTAVSVRQLDAPTAADERTTTAVEQTSLTLRPKRERITFGEGDGVAAIDVGTVTGVTPRTYTDGSPGVYVRHFSDSGRLQTVIRTENERQLDLLRNYFHVRMALSNRSGPVSLLFVGPSREAFVPVAKGLKERNVDVDVAHVSDGQEALDVLADRDVEVVVSQFQFEDEDALTFASDLGRLELSVPIVVFGTEATSVPDDVASRDDVFAYVTLDANEQSRAALVDAIERAVVEVRTA